MNKWIEIILGLILVIVPLILVLPGVSIFASWGIAALEIIKGSVVIFAIMLGLLFIILGISDLKE